jgi:hypothetical protein
MIECQLCDDGRFVCENHPDKPFFGDRACDCGGGGMACPECNVSEVTVPEMPDGFREDPGEAVHFIKCPQCGSWFDCRDIQSALAHEGPLPHPDQPQ